ncbi:dual oxidase maturation factor 1-like [Oppia nitens]|uniref:dual oxidase maturation factor 1-like n=1 Tax=Oppia nitens TaxID=1686743 RepID=UPI0023DB61B7|nr:dual oxidase maturation factor 1-like [Oppia nitens]
MDAFEKVRNTNLYQAFRSEGYPSIYDEYKINAAIDVGLSTIIYTCAAIVLSILLILPGFRGKQRLCVFTRCFANIFIGLSILLCSFEHHWESDSVDINTQYKAGIGRHVNVSIGLKIGLKGVNITLKGIPENQLGEIINYNEHYSWEWDQGRPGFGSQAGRFHREYRESQYRGVPHPIQWVAEYFTFDGEGVRWGRHYRLSGWYTHILMWLSVPLFVLSNILFQMVIQYGALFLIMCGSSLITANIVYSLIRNPIPLRIPFEQYISGQTVYLMPHFSWCYYLNLINGIFCMFIGIVVFFSDLRFPDETAEFFGIDVLQSYEEYFADIKVTSNIKVDINKSKDSQQQQNVSQVYAGLRKRNLPNRLSRLQKSWVRKKPMTQPRSINNDLPLIHGSNHHKDNLIYDLDGETPLYENFRHFDPIEETEENQF